MASSKVEHVVERVSVTPAAAEVIQSLAAEHGPLLFHQSGGCCDGSSPMCYPRREFRIGARDVYLGEIAGCPVYIGGDQFEYWAHTQLTIDVVPGRGGGFSLEAPRGVRFLTRSRVFSDDEWRALEAAGPPPRGDQATSGTSASSTSPSFDRLTGAVGRPPATEESDASRLAWDAGESRAAFLQRYDHVVPAAGPGWLRRSAACRPRPVVAPFTKA